MTGPHRLVPRVWLLLLVLPAGILDAQMPEHVRAGSAGEALQVVLDRNIPPGGPLGGDGATIAGVLVGQSLTFPISSSSGAFALRRIWTFGPGELGVSTSGSFGSLFGERADTNGRGTLSVGANFQRKRWESLSGLGFRNGDLTARYVFRTDIPGQGVAGTVDQKTADVDYRTDVFAMAANYGVFDWLDVGVSAPWINASVDGVKNHTRTPPGAAEGTEISRQRVTGASVGFGDAIIRVKGRLFPFAVSQPSPAMLERDAEIHAARTTLKLAGGIDLRLPTGRTSELHLDCASPPCQGGPTQQVPDLGLGAFTTKVLFIASGDIRRVSSYVNVSYLWVPTYECDTRFAADSRCKGAIFEMDPMNHTPDAKNQGLSDELAVTMGATYQLVPYRTTVSFDVIGRKLIGAGQFYMGPSRTIIRNVLDASVSTEIESRPGDVNTFVGVVGTKIGFNRRWVAAASLLFPLNRQGLQPAPTWLVGIERSLGPFGRDDARSQAPAQPARP